MTADKKTKQFCYQCRSAFISGGITFPITRDHARSRRFLEPGHHAGGEPEAVLAVAADAARQSGSQRVEAIEIRAHKINLRRANGKVTRDADIEAAAEC